MLFKQIDSKEAKRILETKKSILVDIRDSDSFNKSHAKEAFHLTEENITEFILNTEKEKHILVICYHGNSSQTVAEYISEQGFKNVYSILGGYEKWIE